MTPGAAILATGCFLAAGAGHFSDDGIASDHPLATAASRSIDSDAAVVPIDRAVFTDRESPGSDLALGARRFINTAARYNLNWAASHYRLVAESEAGKEPAHILLARRHEYEVRPVAHIIHAVAVISATGALCEESTGPGRNAVLERLIQLIHGAARGHLVNGHAPGWGDQWQSALWAADIAEGAWLVWESLPPATRTLVTEMIVHEANRFIDYRVPYWRNPDHSENFPGDTKAEENAWNSRALTVAIAMMPHHPNSRRWKEKASELLISAYAAPQDLRNRQIVDGREVRSWLQGYNASADFFVINHDRLHNDYSAATRLINKPFITLTLAGSLVPEAAGFNFAKIYDAMATHVFSPGDGWAPPGGTMFRRGVDGSYLPEQYYPDPRGTDWSTDRYAPFLEMDIFAYVLGVDQGENYDATEWAKARLAGLLQRQGRHPDGHLFAEGEHKPWPPMEAFAFDVVADVWMLIWLTANGELSQQRNWLSASQP